MKHPDEAPAPLTTPLEAAFDAALNPPKEQPTPAPKQQPSHAPNPAKGIRPALELYRKRTLNELQEQADAGDAVARYVLAECYRANGYEAESYLPLLQAAAEAALPPAQGVYGAMLCEQGLAAQGEPLVRQAAQYGFGEGAFMLYEQAAARQQGDAARRWLELAAKTPCRPAFLALADCYGNGTFFPKDIETAAHWMKRAADTGDVESCYRYAQLILSSPGLLQQHLARKEMFRYLRLAAKRGHTEALFELARQCCIYYEHRERYLTQAEISPLAKKDDDLYYWWQKMEHEAAKLYVQAAETGPELKKRVLRCLEDSSQRVFEDVLRTLAAHGDAEACFLMGQWRACESHSLMQKPHQNMLRRVRKGEYYRRPRWMSDWQREAMISYYKCAAEAGYAPAIDALRHLTGKD